MAVKYCKSGATGSADGSSWANAYTTISALLAGLSAGDRGYISQSHSEITTGQKSPDLGSSLSGKELLCANDGAEPPTALATGASYGSTTGPPLILMSGFGALYGMTLEAKASYTEGIRIGSSAAQGIVLDTCTLNGGDIAPGCVISANRDYQAYIEFRNCALTFDSTSRAIRPAGGVFRMIGGSAAASGTVPTTFIIPNIAAGAFNQEYIGVDLSAFGSGKNLVDVSNSQNGGSIRFIDCKLGASVAITTGTQPGPGVVVELINCDSGDTNYRYYRKCYEGEVFHESTIVRSGGASDGTTPISRKMVSGSGTKFWRPLKSGPIAIWNETTGSSVTVTVEVITDGVTLTDAEAWLEVDYLGTSGFPKSSRIIDRSTDILATPANQTTSSVSWTTTGLTSPTKQKLSVSFTPQEKGLIRARVMLAKASTTMYFCPKLDVS